MTTWEEGDHDWVAVYWVKRLSHNAKPIGYNSFPLINERSIIAADRTYEIFSDLGPPPRAIVDRQKQLVYDWEDDNILPAHDTPMNWKGCEYFASYVWERVGTGKPLMVKPHRRYSGAVSLPGIISLPQKDKRYWTKPIILHEIAHELSPNDQHGIKFVTVYMRLLSRFLGYNITDLKESAARYGVSHNFS